jgi:hypothetical protein
MGRDQPRHAVLWIVVNFHTYAPTPMRIPATKKTQVMGILMQALRNGLLLSHLTYWLFAAAKLAYSPNLMFPSRSLNAQAVHTSSFRIQEQDVFYHCNQV